MSDHFYSVTFGCDVDPGGNIAGTSPSDPTGTAVVLDTSTTIGSKIELRVTDATTGIVGNKVTLLAGLEKIKNYIIESIAPA